MSLRAVHRRMLMRAARSMACMARLTINVCNIVCSSTKSILQQQAWSNANEDNKVLIATRRCTPGMAAGSGGQC
eukprot:666029-Pelagomonas_calceolata.AAC.1